MLVGVNIHIVRPAYKEAPGGTPSGGSRGGARVAPGPLILGKKKKNHRRKKSWQGKQNKTWPSLSSRSGSATDSHIY